MVTQRCELCEKLNILALIDNLEPYQLKLIAHHPTYAALLKAAEAGCDLCVLLQASLFRDEHTGSDERPNFLRRTSTGFSSQSTFCVVDDVVGWHQELDQRLDVPAFVLEIKAESTMSTNFAPDYVLHYQRPMVTNSIIQGPKPRRLVLSCDERFESTICRRPVADYPRLNIYKQWLENCAHGPRHRQCIPAQDVTLPTRVIDVGVGTEASMPKIVHTRGERGQYLTLSHCWGKTQHLTTTKANLADHLFGIPFSQFPSIFPDALLVARMLKYRYIWIDSLCIVQDDPSDWERECSCMGDIYRLSTCTLAAPDATDSDGRLLEKRIEPSSPACRLNALRDGQECGKIHLGFPSTSIKTTTNALATRAWVLQESLLAARTLCFTRNGMYFQCKSHEYMEDLHHPLPPQRLTPWRTTQPTDLPKNLLFMASKDPAYWYSIARQYSFRSLTYGDDKLPALSGLANFLAAMWNESHLESHTGEYWAGLWSGDLGRGLLWTSDSMPTLSDPLHGIDISAPSWSWASQNTPVIWTVLHNFTPEFNVVSCDLELMTMHKFGQVRKAQLILNAKIRSASLQRRPPGSQPIFLGELGGDREVAAISFDGTAAELLESLWPGQDPAFLCRLMMLGQAQSSLYGLRWYALVLLQTASGTYRRIGIASSLEGGATHARSLSVEQSYSWFEIARRADVVID